MERSVLIERLRGIGTPLGDTVFGYSRGDMKRAGEAAAEIAKICFAAANTLSATPAAQPEGDDKCSTP